MSHRSLVRRPAAAVTGAALVLTLLAGCGGDDTADTGETDDGGSADAAPSAGASTAPSAAGAEPSTESASPGASEPAAPETSGAPEATDGPTSGDGVPVPPDAVAFCEVFTTAVLELDQSFEGAGDPNEQVDPVLLDGLRELGGELADVPLPAGMTPDQRAGVALMAEVFTSLPETSTYADFAAIDDDLGEADAARADAATQYAFATCDFG